MTYSPEWDAQYAAGKQRTQWPNSDLIGLVKRYAGPGRVLELGCGAGANMQFFKAIDCDYHGIDGSAVAVDAARKQAVWMRHGEITLGDFTKFLPPGPFDLVIDRAALSHNDTDSIHHCLRMIYEILSPAGLFIGVDWFSDRHDEYANGVPDTDEFTRADYIEGQFAGVGRVHFSDEGHLRELFERFEFAYLEEKVVRRIVPSGRAATWNMVCKKILV